MRVKIGDKWYDSEEEPIVVELSDQDKINIAHMSEIAKKYCSFPEGLSRDKVREWMNS